MRSNKSNGSIEQRSMNLSMRVMKLKLSGKVSNDISTRKQVGDAEDMFKEDGEKPWWKNVGMEEGM